MITIGGGGGIKTLRQRVAEVLRFIAPYITEGDVVVDVHLVTDKFMKANVHSYVAPLYFSRPDIVGKFLGDIYLNPTHIVRHHEDFDHLLIHGFLHLLGYDHGRDDDRIRMEALEAKLINQIQKLTTNAPNDQRKF